MKKKKRELNEKQLEANEKRWHKDRLKELMEMLWNADPRIYNALSRGKMKKITKPFGSCYIHGVVGSGKSVEGAWRMLEWSRLQQRFGKRKNKTIFINTLELLHELKRTYSEKNKMDEQEVLKKYKDIPLLVLDDFGLTSSTEWAYQMLYIIINWRYTHLLPTIYTSNHSLEEIANIMNDDRITSRIAHDCGEDNIIQLASF